MCKKLKISLREQNFFQSEELFFKILVLNNKMCIKEIEYNSKKYAVDSAIQFPTNSNLRSMVFFGATRVRGS